MKSGKAAYTRPDPHTDRQRTIVAIDMIRMALQFNPKAALQPKCRDARVSPLLVDELAEIGAIEQIGEQGGRRRFYKWTGGESSVAVFEKLILKRRAADEAREKEAAARAASEAKPAPGTEFLLLKSRLDGHDASLRTVMEDIKRLGQQSQQPAGLSAADSELLNLIMEDNTRIANDQAQMRAQLLGIEAQLAELHRRFFEKAGREHVAAVAPVALPRLKVGVIGIHERDHQHLLDAIRSRLGARHKALEIEFIGHGPGKTTIPTTLNAVIVTQNGHKRGMEAQSLYPKSTYHLRGTGTTSVVNQLATMVNALAPAAAA